MSEHHYLVPGQNHPTGDVDNRDVVARDVSERATRDGPFPHRRRHPTGVVGPHVFAVRVRSRLTAQTISLWDMSSTDHTRSGTRG